MPSRSQYGRVMNESFDQHEGQSPLPSTGSRQDAQSGGKARSSAVRTTVRARSVAPLTRGEAAMLAKIDIARAYRSATRLSLAMTMFTGTMQRRGHCKKQATE